MKRFASEEDVLRAIDDVTDDLIHEGTFEDSTALDVGQIALLRVGEIEYVHELATAGGWNVGLT